MLILQQDQGHQAVFSIRGECPIRKRGHRNGLYTAASYSLDRIGAAVRHSTFSLDGRHAYPSTGEVIDVQTKKVLAALTDEKGREVHGEKMLEIAFRGGDPVRAGDQFGVDRVTGPR